MRSMRFHKLVLIQYTSLIAALLAGFLVGLFYVNQVVVASAALMFIGAVAVVIVFHNKLRSGLRRLQQQIENPNGTGETGLREFDDIARQIQRCNKAAQDQANHVQAEFDELNRLVAELCRRGNDNRGAASPLRQLRGILSSLGKSIDSDMRQIQACGREIERCVDQIAVGSQDQSTAVGKSARMIENISGLIDAVSENVALSPNFGTIGS